MRSVDSPGFPVPLSFVFGSADLTSISVPRVEIRGRALSDPRLARQKFQINVYTDDVSTDDYNRELSATR